MAGIKFDGDKLTRLYSAIATSMAYVGQNGVNTGCQVVESSPTAMTVEVETGTVFFSSSPVAVGAQTLAIDSNATSNTRLDLIVVNNAGTASVIKGTAGSPAPTPDYDPETYVLLAVISVVSGITAITDSQIIDGRAINNSGGASGTSFTGLSDTPSTFVGQAGKIPIVNSGETDLVFSDAVYSNISNDFPIQDGDPISKTDINKAFYQGAFAGSLNHASVNIGSSATLIKAANPSRQSILIKNNGSSAIYIGNASVTTSSGFELKSKESILLYNKEAIYGITSSATEDLRYLEAQ